MNPLEVLQLMGWNMNITPDLPITSTWRLKSPPRRRKKRLMKKWVRDSKNWREEKSLELFIDNLQMTIHLPTQFAPRLVHYLETTPTARRIYGFASSTQQAVKS